MRPGEVALAVASFIVLALPGTAMAQRASSSGSSQPVALPPSRTQAAPGHPHMQLLLEGFGAQAPFALANEPLDVRGTVVPYALGQRVRVSFYRDGHLVAARTVAVKPHGTSEGQFHVNFPNVLPGRVRVLAALPSTAQIEKLAAASEDITVLGPLALEVGTRGATVWLLQRALGALHYAVPQTGYFDQATAEAVVAYRKMTGLPPVSEADASVFRTLKRGAGAFPVRYRQDGRHIEADLSKQVLAEIETGGRVYNIYPTSSGKPATPTVTGHFRVYLKTPGLNSEEMLDANYFIGGYAIHGYPEVPTYAASHGCLRVPNLDAPSIYGWVRIGTPVDVYD